jgi:hypothetical protein
MPSPSWPHRAQPTGSSDTSRAGCECGWPYPIGAFLIKSIAKKPGRGQDKVAEFNGEMRRHQEGLFEIVLVDSEFVPD